MITTREKKSKTSFNSKELITKILFMCIHESKITDDNYYVIYI